MQRRDHPGEYLNAHHHHFRDLPGQPAGRGTAGVDPGLRARGDGDPARYADGGAFDTALDHDGPLWTRTGLLRPPADHGFGRMWLSLTASTVMVQFFQVVALVLGGTPLSSLGASNLFNLGGTLPTLLVSVVLLYLVLCVPGIVHRFALHPIMDTS